MYENETEAVIKQRMLSNAPTGINTLEGDFFNDAISPAALELRLAYQQLDKVLELGFAETAYGGYLEKIAAEGGIDRKPAAKGQGIIEVTMLPGSTIHAGDVLATVEGNIRFKALETKTVDGSGKALVQFENESAGKLGVIPPGKEFIAPAAITGFISARNPEQINAGTDVEPDELLRQRYLERTRNPSTSGNEAHFIQWAKEVSGVGDAKVFPLWNGNGTVKVVLLDSNMQPASAGLIDEVSGYIETVRPVCCAVTVVSAGEKVIAVSAKVALADGFILNDVQNALIDRLKAHFMDIAFKQPYLSYAWIGYLILSVPGIINYADLLVNNGTADILFDSEEVPQLGTVSLTV